MPFDKITKRQGQKGKGTIHILRTVVIRTKKEPKPDHRLSKFDWQDLSQFFGP